MTETTSLALLDNTKLQHTTVRFCTPSFYVHYFDKKSCSCVSFCNNYCNCMNILHRSRFVEKDLTTKRRNGYGVAESESEQAGEFKASLWVRSTKMNTPGTGVWDTYSDSFMDDMLVSAEGVTKLLKCSSSSKALGPNELRLRVLNELAPEFGPTFAYLFRAKNLLTRVKFPTNALWQIYVRSSKKETGRWHAVTGLRTMQVA